MVEVELALPLEVAQKVDGYAKDKGITPSEAVSNIVSGFTDEVLALKLFSTMWDKGFNSFPKINKAIGIIIDNYTADEEIEKAAQATYSVLDDAKPQLPYNPFAVKLEYKKLMPIMDCQDFLREEHMEILQYIRDEYPDSPNFTMMYAFIYGTIFGKRAERARRAKH